MVASTIINEYPRLVSPFIPLLNKSKMLPPKAIKIPVIFFEGTWYWKRRNPVIIANIGVSALSVPASALSIFVSAIQNKYAGNRLPKRPDKNT